MPRNNNWKAILYNEIWRYLKRSPSEKENSIMRMFKYARSKTKAFKIYKVLLDIFSIHFIKMMEFIISSNNFYKAFQDKTIKSLKRYCRSDIFTFYLWNSSLGLYCLRFDMCFIMYIYFKWWLHLLWSLCSMSIPNSRNMECQQELSTNVGNKLVVVFRVSGVYKSINTVML